MHIGKEDNTVYILQKAIRRYKIKVTDTSIRKFLLSHPLYPTLKSISDALNKWGINHYPLKLENVEIKELNLPFIAHLNVNEGIFVFVEKIKNGNVFYSEYKGENKKLSFPEFAEKLSGVVVIIEADELAGEKEYKHLLGNEIINKSLLPIIVFGVLTLMISYIFMNPENIWSRINLRYIILSVLNVIGFIVSLLLVLHELKIHSSLSNRICKINSKVNCEEVLASKAANLFGWLNWGDVGLIYFLGAQIYLFRSVGTSSIILLAVIGSLSLSYTIFSIYYQSIILRKWCPLCMMVQMVLIAEFLFYIPLLKVANLSNPSDIFYLIFSFTIPGVFWIIYRAYYNKLTEYKNIQYSYLQFKRNPEIFQFLLAKNGHFDFSENKTSLIIGPLDAPVNITAFLSLYCSPCAEVFKELKLLLNKSSQIKINIVFTIYSDAEVLKVINIIYYLHSENGPESVLEFLDNWYSLSTETRKGYYNQYKLPEHYNIVQQISNENMHLFEKFQIAGTPTVFINGYLFPKQYEYGDLELYFENIILLNRVKKRQEANVFSG